MKPYRLVRTATLEMPFLVFMAPLALGAFLAGMVLGQSPLSQKAAEQTLPLRDAFAVLFFVSVGMLFDPAILWHRPLEVAGTLAVVVGGKALAAWGIARVLGQDQRAALTIAAALGQIGEFSFILAGLGVAAGLLPVAGRDLVLAAALLSIALNPALFWLGNRLSRPRDLSGR
jgi:CPA2 family monovalent cation:H+ antiporter-2